MPIPTNRLLAILEAEGLVPPDQAVAIREDERTRPFSLHYELRALLYLGITLLVGGLGVLVYQHLDSIGHNVIIGAIVLAMSASFAYAARHQPVFTWSEAPRTSIAADYLLLLSCLLFLVLEGYLQAQYGLFGTRYGLAAVLPAGVFLALAYRYDHRGVLAMGITALGSWVGVSVAPLALFSGHGFPAAALSGPGLLLGLGLLAAGAASERWRRKSHFAYTYFLMGSNLALLSALVRLTVEEGTSTVTLWRSLAVLLLMLGICTVLWWYACRTQSYIFLLLATGYGYVAVTAVLLVLLELSGLKVPIRDTLWPLILIYFMASAGGMIILFNNSKKILRLV